ncbi:MAG TPA: aminopeptidase [Candidatus Pacearchaeota archaeon]|nr:aminopeptidase 2 [archaeon BMS3Abin17]HDK42267.1 aminopeptidase [Candidatus Pacearchaeota archaeon]HDZ61371.1 aminopeptidase [Candidatus Pacearchaeota archaeon]
MPIDLRTKKLAQLAVRYSVFVKPRETVIISGGIEAVPFLVELYKEIILRKAFPIVRMGLPDISDFFYKYATKEQIEHFPQHLMDLYKQADKTISIVTDLNTKELTNSDSKKISTRQKIVHPISDYVVNEKDKIRRCTIAYPVIALAQEAEMSLTEYENFVYQACLIDWKKFGKRLDKISNKFEKGKDVHLIGEGVDLKFSIKGKNCVADKGEENMPGGEVFMALVRESLNGWIKFDYPAIRAGKEVLDIELKFENGKVVESKASKNQDFLKETLNLDENAKYVGEFGIGCNPKINKFTNELLFDEKIDGTIHLALGMAYKENGGGNDSAVHWDIVKDMKKAKIILDGKVVQENGKWKI